MLVYPEQCKRCKHFQKDRPGGYCAAFPDSPGIPMEILNMQFDHRREHPGDHGIRWEPATPGALNPFDEEDAPTPP